MPTTTGSNLGTVLGVWTHPDDEAYLSSGLMAQAVAAGSRVVCVTATRGEGGSFDPERWPPDTMGDIRAAELQRCLALLGVTEHVFLDLPDVDWHTPLPEEGAAAVTDLLKDVAPDTVLTFGPDGMTNHEGHKSVSTWATDAFHSHARAGARLYYAVESRGWAEQFLPRLRDLGAFRDDVDPPVVEDAELALDLRLDGALLDLKVAAIREHASQIEGLMAAFGDDLWAQAMSRESFVLAAQQGRYR